MWRKALVAVISTSLLISCTNKKIVEVIPETKTIIIYETVYETVFKEVIIEKIKYTDEYSLPTDFCEPMKDYFISSKFGFRQSPMGGVEGEFNMHKGLDLVGKKNSPVYAVKEGVVAINFPPPNGHYKGHPIYGGLIIIDHGKGLYTLYAHLSKGFVTEKQVVKKGQQIGVQGNTGQSTGPHLHFEILVDPKYALSYTN